MGYFSTGTEGMDYEKQYCSRCIHRQGTDGMGCPVWFAHIMHNYDVCNKPESILHILIPRTKDGWNAQCAMFVQDKNALDPNQLELIPR